MSPTPDELLVELMMSAEGHRDPHSRYRTLRDLAPVHRSELAPLWVCTRYAECHAVLRDNRFGKGDRRRADDDDGSAFWARRADEEPHPVFSRSLIQLDPPDHTRVRGLVSRAFTPRRVEALDDAVGSICAELLDRIADAGEVELLDALGFTFPVRVIGELVGVPREDRDQFRPLVRDAASSLEPGVDDAVTAKAAVAGEQLVDYFRDLIAQRRREPRDDLASALVAARDDDDRLTEEELLATLILVFAAGFETTTNLIGNGVVTLLTHPDELARLRADRSLVPAAVEEILRYESPVQVDARTAIEPAEIDGRRVQAGEWVITLLGAANRDPAAFEDPETFAIRERDTAVLSFASGIHYCLGASLARMEGRVVFGQLLERFGTWELLDDEPRWRDSLVLRGLTECNVRFTT